MRYTIAFILLLFTTHLQAQWNIGIKAGTNFSWINYDAAFNQRLIDLDLKIGYMGGLTIQNFSQPNIGLQMEVLYIQKGFKTRLDSISLIQYERTIDYLTFPALMHVYAGKKRFNFSLMLGPYISYAIASEEVYTENGSSIVEKYTFNREHDNRFEFGLQGGIGFRNTFKFGIIELEGFFTFGFTSIYKWGAKNEDPDKDRFFIIPEQAQNQGIQITLSYYRSFGKIPEKK